MSEHTAENDASPWGDGLACSVCGALWTTCWATRRHRVISPGLTERP